MAEEDKNSFLKNAAKLAAAGLGAYMLHKDPKGALLVAGGLAGDATRQKEELIKQRGEQLAADREYYRQRADLLFANRQEQYRVDSEKTGEMNNALQSLASSSALGSTKREIALGALAVKGLIPSTGTKIQIGSGLDLQLQNEIARIQEVTGEDGKVTGYKYIGDAMPVKPKLSDFYDEKLVTQAEEDIAKGTYSTLSQKLFKKEDKGADALAQLQADMNEGYQTAIDSPFRSNDDKVEVEFKARPESVDEESAVVGTAIISKNSGETINLNVPSKFPLVYVDDDNLTTTQELNSKKEQTAIFDRIESNYKTQTDDASSDFTQNTFNAIQAVLPGADLKALADYEGSKVLGTKAEGAHLFMRTQSLMMEIAEANYHRAGWETGNDGDNNKNALTKRLEMELPRRIISLDTDNIGFDSPIAGTYVIPTNVLPLYVNLPSTVKSIDGTDVEVETMSYLQEELNKTLDKFGEDEGKTMASVASILDAKVAEILYPQEASQVKAGIATVSEDGQSYTIGGETDTFKSLQELLPQLDEAQKSAIPSSVMEQYNIWLGTQESGDSEIVDKTSVDNQVQELVPDISKMKLAKAIEKNVITEEYLNNLSYNAPGGANQEAFSIGGTQLMQVGDIITTKDGKKYESYPDTVKNEFDRDVTTIRFRPITEE